MTLVTLYDSASGSWPLKGQGAGGYLITYVDAWGGDWAGVHYPSNFLWAKARFPKAWCIQTSVVSPGAPDVALYDCELGALSVDEVCADVNTELVKKERRPALYGTQSTRDEIFDWLAKYYTRWQLGRDIDFVLADWNGVADVPEGNAAHQYLNNAFYDTTVADPSWAALRPV